MATCKKGYGDQQYALSPYGSGEYIGISARDIVMYFSNADGTINLDAPITNIPVITPGEYPHNRIDDLTKEGLELFSDIKGLAVGNVFVSVYKVFIRNNNPDYDFSDVSVAIDPTSDPFGWLKISYDEVGMPIPNADEMNVTRNGGPRQFDDERLNLGTLVKGGGTSSFWVQRRVFVLDTKPQYVTHRFFIRGTTSVDGEQCPQ